MKVDEEQMMDRNEETIRPREALDPGKPSKEEVATQENRECRRSQTSRSYRPQRWLPSEDRKPVQPERKRKQAIDTAVAEAGEQYMEHERRPRGARVRRTLCRVLQSRSEDPAQAARPREHLRRSTWTSTATRRREDLKRALK